MPMHRLNLCARARLWATLLRPLHRHRLCVRAACQSLNEMNEDRSKRFPSLILSLSPSRHRGRAGGVQRGGWGAGGGGVGVRHGQSEGLLGGLHCDCVGEDPRRRVFVHQIRLFAHGLSFGRRCLHVGLLRARALGCVRQEAEWAPHELVAEHQGAPVRSVAPHNLQPHAHWSAGARSVR